MRGADKVAPGFPATGWSPTLPIACYSLDFAKSQHEYIKTGRGHVLAVADSHRHAAAAGLPRRRRHDKSPVGTGAIHD